MGAEIRIYEVGDEWALMPGSSGTTSFGATFDGWYETVD